MINQRDSFRGSFRQQTFRQSFHGFVQGQNINIFKFTQKQVTNLICKIEGRPHQIKDYKHLLQKKQQFQKQNNIYGIVQSIINVLQPKLMKNNFIEDQSNQLDNMCPVCFQQMNKPSTCNICKNFVCKKCISRNRQLKSDLIVKFCEPCDRKFLQATISKQFYKQVTLYQKTFLTLITQQQNLQILLAVQKQKIKSQQHGTGRFKILQNAQKIHKLKQQKQNLKQKLHQINNKITWGQSMTKSLRIKHRKLLKLLKQSFTSSVKDQNQNFDWQPPKADQDIQLQIQNINQSFVTNMIENNQQDQDAKASTQSNICSFQCTIM